MIQQSRLFHFLETGREQIRADSRQAVNQVSEALRPPDKLSNYQKGPTLPHNIECTGNCAVLMISPLGHLFSL